MAHSAGFLSVRTAFLALALMAALFGAPGDAKADASQLCRAGANLVLAPFDALLAPVIISKDMYYGLTEIDDPMGLKIAGAVPGFIFLNGVQVGGAIFREIAAVFERSSQNLRRDSALAAMKPSPVRAFASRTTSDAARATAASSSPTSASMRARSSERVTGPPRRRPRPPARRRAGPTYGAGPP